MISISHRVAGLSSVLCVIAFTACQSTPPEDDLETADQATLGVGDDVSDGLRSDTTQEYVPFGSFVGSFNGVDAYSNGSTNQISDERSAFGIKWQCVEYVNRYYYEVLGHRNLKATGNANRYYDTAAGKGLFAHENGGTVPPAVHDILASDGGTYGHVAIVREVGKDYVRIIHQNWANDGRDNEKTLSMTVSNGHYTVNGFSGAHAIQGWLRQAPEGRR